ncbi:MAG: dockerin type I repeat-containing protein [Oscillospiraceae bacterium]|jgi:hypothetical protein|nr:dockerin type I repeat-containing protein [Oscillospiraceae bacterium]
MKKKFLSAILAAVMCLSLFVMPTFAEDEADGVKTPAELAEYFATFNAFLANTGDGPVCPINPEKALDRLNQWNSASQDRILRAASYVRWVNSNPTAKADPNRNATNAYYIFQQAYAQRDRCDKDCLQAHLDNFRADFLTNNQLEGGLVGDLIWAPAAYSTFRSIYIMAEREIETASIMRIQQLCCAANTGLKWAHEEMEKTRYGVVTLHDMRALEQRIDNQIRLRDRFTDNRRSAGWVGNHNHGGGGGQHGDSLVCCRNWGSLNSLFYTRLNAYIIQEIRFANASQTAGVYRTSNPEIRGAYAAMDAVADALEKFDADNTGVANVFDLQALIARNAVGLIQRQNGVTSATAPGKTVMPGGDADERFPIIGTGDGTYAGTNGHGDATNSSLQNNIPLVSVPIMGTGALAELYTRILEDYDEAFGVSAEWRHANGTSGLGTGLNGLNATSMGVALFYDNAYRPLEIVVRRWDGAYMGVINWNNSNTALRTVWGVANAYSQDVGGGAVTQAMEGNYMTVSFTANIAMDFTPHVEINPLETGANGDHIISYDDLDDMGAPADQFRAAYRSMDGIARTGDESTIGESRRLFNLQQLGDIGVGYNQVNWSRAAGSTVWAIGANGVINTETGVSSACYNTGNPAGGTVAMTVPGVSSYNIKFTDEFAAMGWIFRELAYRLNYSPVSATTLEGISLAELIAARDAAFRSGQEYNFMPPALFQAITQARNEATALINIGVRPVDSAGGWLAVEVDNNVNGHGYMLSRNKINHALAQFDAYYEAYRVTMEMVLDKMYESAKEDYYGVETVDAARVALARAIPNLTNVGARRFFEGNGAIMETMRPGLTAHDASIGLGAGSPAFAPTTQAALVTRQILLAWAVPFSQTGVREERTVRQAYDALFAAIDKVDNPDPDNVLLGDVNGDGEIDEEDALEILKFLVGLESALDEMTEDEALAVADINGDGEIDEEDALEILKFLVGLPSALDED